MNLCHQTDRLHYFTHKINIDNAVEGKLIQLITIIPNINQRINDVIMRSITTNPKERFQSATELAHEMFLAASESKMLEAEKDRNERKGEISMNKSQKWEKIMACIFGFLFISIMLMVAILLPNPTVFQIFIFRVVLSLAASGIGALIPGFLNVEMKKEHLFFIRAGGAIALFLIVYFLNPPELITGGELTHLFK